MTVGLGFGVALDVNTGLALGSTLTTAALGAGLAAVAAIDVPPDRGSPWVTPLSV